MYKFTLTISEHWTPESWSEFERIVEYVFQHYKGETYSVSELAIQLDRSYRDKVSVFYPVHQDGAILVHLKSEVEARGLKGDLGSPMFTISKS